MPTISGPMTIGGGKELSEEVKGNLNKLPFSATGWKSTKNEHVVTGIRDKQISVQDVKAISEDRIIYSKTELYALNKSEQVAMLKDLGVNKIPRLEKTRVKKILELQ